MTTTLQSRSLEECIHADLKTAHEKLPIPGLSIIFKKRIQWYYICGFNVECPDEMKQWTNRSFKRSAIQLQPTTESLRKLKKVFRKLSNEGSFNDPEIKYFNFGKASVIIYSVIVPTVIKPRNH